MQRAAAGYLLLLNLGSFLLYGADKRCAIRRAWRISERTLLLSAMLGGAAGALLGMWLFRHKTRKLRFTLGIPLLFLIWLLAGIVLYSKCRIAGV